MKQQMLRETGLHSFYRLLLRSATWPPQQPDTLPISDTLIDPNLTGSPKASWLGSGGGVVDRGLLPYLVMKNNPLPRLDTTSEWRNRLLPYCRLKAGEVWQDPDGTHRVGCLDATDAEAVAALVGGST